LNAAWNSLRFANGEERKFQKNQWLEMLQDPVFKDRVLEVMDIEIIRKFDDRTGDAASFYDIDGEDIQEENNNQI